MYIYPFAISHCSSHVSVCVYTYYITQTTILYVLHHFSSTITIISCIIYIIEVLRYGDTKHKGHCEMSLQSGRQERRGDYL